jgi:hypothetical protein
LTLIIAAIANYSQLKFENSRRGRGLKAQIGTGGMTARRRPAKSVDDDSDRGIHRTTDRA